MKILTLFFLLLLTSCSYTYLVKTTSQISSLQSTNPYFENDTLIVKYNFWCNGGGFTFSIENKLNQPLYIDWKKSVFFIQNTSMPYWQDKEDISSRSAGSSYTFQRNSLLSGVSIGSSNTESVISKPERITFLAPKSKYRFNGYNISVFTQQIGYNDKPKKDTVLKWNFDATNTPLAFRNFISLSDKESFEHEFYIDHRFWVNQVIKMRTEKFDGSPIQTNSARIKSDDYTFPYKQKNSFYIKAVD